MIVLLILAYIKVAQSQNVWRYPNPKPKLLFQTHVGGSMVNGHKKCYYQEAPI